MAAGDILTPDRAGGHGVDPVSAVSASSLASSLSPHSAQDPIYAPVRQRWVIRKNYFVMIENDG